MSENKKNKKDAEVNKRLQSLSLKRLQKPIQELNNTQIPLIETPHKKESLKEKSIKRKTLIKDSISKEPLEENSYNKESLLKESLNKTPLTKVSYLKTPLKENPLKEIPAKRVAEQLQDVIQAKSSRDYYAMRIYNYISASSLFIKRDDLMTVIGKNSKSTLARALSRGEKNGWWTIESYYSDAHAKKHGKDKAGTYFTLLCLK